ncbi:MAG: helix-turn-helix transcriptional regulator [Methanospirillum sp.]|nr:helix-turn-helix transcriptional regulator [Methanospirillum sp.]
MFRAEHDMTQEQLAQLIGITRNTVISIEKGKYYPSLLIGYRIARLFNVGIDEVFIFEDGLDDYKTGA